MKRIILITRGFITGLRHKKRNVFEAINRFLILSSDKYQLGIGNGGINSSSYSFLKLQPLTPRFAQPLSAEPHTAV